LEYEEVLPGKPLREHTR